MPPLLVAAIVVLLEGLAFGVILPVLPEFVERLGGGSAWAGIAFALATAPRVVCAPLWGKLSEIRGRRLSLVLVSLGTMSASIVWAYCGQLGEIAFGGLVWLMISRALYGLFAAQSVLGLAVASDVSTPEKRAGAMGVVGAAFGIAFTVGPWVGGEFAHAYSEAAVGWLMAAFQLGSVIVVLTLLKETHPEHAPGEVDERVEQAGVYVRPSRLMALVFAPAVAWMLIVCFLATVSYSVVFPTFQTLAEAWYAWDMGHVGFALSIFGLIGAFVQGGLIRPTVRALGEGKTAALGLLFLVAGLGWVAAHPTVTGFWVALSLMAVGTGFVVPSILAMMSLSVGPHDQGPVHGLNQSATSLGRAAGYLVGGGLFALSPTWAYGAAAGVGVLAMLLLYPARSAAPSHRDADVAAEDNTPDNPEHATDQ